jgi:hypothetical protein
MVSRLAAGVAPGRTLFLVGHLPVDPATCAPTPAAGQVQVSVETPSKVSTHASETSYWPRSGPGPGAPEPMWWCTRVLPAFASLTEASTHTATSRAE